MKTFGSESSDFFTNISGPNLFKIRMNISFFFIASASIASNKEEIFMNIIQEIFESEFVDQTISVKIIFLAQIISIPILAQNIFILIETTSTSNSFTSINIKKIKVLFSKKKRPNTKSIKKRKSNEINEILLFIFELSQQKIKQIMYQVKIALFSAYTFSENVDILITIDLINQIMKGKSKVFEKIQFSNIHAKLDRNLKKFDDSKKSTFTIESNVERKKAVKSFIQKIKFELFIFLPSNSQKSEFGEFDSIIQIATTQNMNSNSSKFHKFFKRWLNQNQTKNVQKQRIKKND